jgi:hypothetical protein
MTLWAIQWGPYPRNRGKGWIDHTTVSMRRRDAWQKFKDNEAPTTDHWKAELKRRRRNGWIKAVRVKLERVES